MQTEAERRALLVLAAGDDRRIPIALQTPETLTCACGNSFSLPLAVTWGIWRECPDCGRIWCIEE